MILENDRYVAIVESYRVPNQHASFRFHYVVTRKFPDPMLMVSGSAESEKEAAARVDAYLRKFAERDARRAAHDNDGEQSDDFADSA